MIKIAYSPTFLRQLSNLQADLQAEAISKIDLFRDPNNHKQLRVHKLKGGLKDRFSFSVNYRYRAVFKYLSKKETVLLAIGDHDVYKD